MADTDEIASRLRAVFRFLKRRADALAGKNAPTHSEQSVLVWLDEKGAMTPIALAHAQQVRPQSIGQTLDALTRRRWIRRTPHPDDRRQVLISLTSSGQKALTKGRNLRQAWLVKELNNLNSRDRQTLASALTILESFLNP